MEVIPRIKVKQLSQSSTFLTFAMAYQQLNPIFSETLKLPFVFQLNRRQAFRDVDARLMKRVWNMKRNGEKRER